MKVIRSDAGISPASLDIALNLAAQKELDEHRLKMRLAYFAMSLVGLGFVFLVTLITLSCFGVITLPYYVLSPLAAGTTGCGAALLYKVAKHFYSANKQ